MQQRARHVASVHAEVRHRLDHSRACAGEPPQGPRKGPRNYRLGGAGEAGTAYARGVGVCACVGASFEPCPREAAPPCMLSVLGPCSPLTRVCAGGHTQCIERAHGDNARLEDVLDKELQRDDIEDPAPSGSCLVCFEELAQPTHFDCGHPVCFACTTKTFLAQHQDAVYCMPCPGSVEGCKGQISFLSCASARDGFMCAADSPEAVSEWRRYLPAVENAMLRAAGMYRCPSAACTNNDILLFIPLGKTQAAEDTECERCGLHICTTCTRTAGKVVAFHAPFPCAQRVAFEGQLSAIQAGMQRANEQTANQRAAAVQRAREESEREAAGRHILRRHIPRQHEEVMWERWNGRLEETRRGWSGRHCPKIDEHVFELLGKGERTVSYVEIFDAAATATKAAAEREKQMALRIDGAQGINGAQAAGHGTSGAMAGQNAGRSTTCKKRREHSPTTKRALANYETFHGLPAGKASVDQV
jgi:hypothetical protein